MFADIRSAAGPITMAALGRNPPQSAPTWQHAEFNVRPGVHTVTLQLRGVVAPDGTSVPGMLDNLTWRADPAYGDFLDWSRGFGLEWPDSLSSGDGDGDGWPALIEYVSGLSPTQSDASDGGAPFSAPSPPRLILEPAPDESLRLRVDYVQRESLGAGVFTVERSTDEARSWEPLAMGVRSGAPLTGFPGLIAVTVVVGVDASPPSQFFRLRARLP